jgi:hypothetical protein
MGPLQAFKSLANLYCAYTECALVPHVLSASMQWVLGATGGGNLGRPTRGSADRQGHAQHPERPMAAQTTLRGLNHTYMHLQSWLAACLHGVCACHRHNLQAFGPHSTARCAVPYCITLGPCKWPRGNAERPQWPLKCAHMQMVHLSWLQWFGQLHLVCTKGPQRYPLRVL